MVSMAYRKDEVRTVHAFWKGARQPESVWISIIALKNPLKHMPVDWSFQAAHLIQASSARFTRLLFPECVPQFCFRGIHITQGGVAKQ